MNKTNTLHDSLEANQEVASAIIDVEQVTKQHSATSDEAIISYCHKMSRLHLSQSIKRRTCPTCSTSLRTMRTLSVLPIVAVALILISMRAEAFSMSMVASTTPAPPSVSGFGRVFGGASSQATGGLISQLAEVALKMRLAGEKGVNCDVTADSGDLLLRGRVGPVTVTGRGWQSRLGLTCRAIEATVDTCDLDIGRVFTDRKIRLTTAAKGNAMVALNAVDFGNFITHPLMKRPEIPSASSSQEPFTFMRENVQVNSAKGTVEFFGDYLGETWRCTLQRGQGSAKALVTVEPTSDKEESSSEMAAELSRVVTNFFNEMVFELDGTFLNFSDMMVTGKGEAPSVMLALNILVKKFPSRGLAF